MEIGTLQVPSSIQFPASSFQNSTRNTPGSRNRHISSDTNDLIFSTRNKTGGVADLAAVVHGAASPSSIQPLASSFQNSNRNTSANRNRLNPPAINDIIFSNRNKIRGGSPTENQPQFSKIKRAVRVSVFCRARLLRWLGVIE